MSMKIGIFGGTFDPIHRGHLKALENFTKRVSPQKTLVIPAGVPPHKKESTTPVEDRVNMLRAAVRNFPNTEICLYEAEKEGKCYTYDTLVYLHKTYPDAEFTMFVGSDMLLSFDRWYRVEDIAKMTSLAVFSRHGDDLEALTVKINELKKSIGLKAELFTDEPTEISSTEIRNAVKNGSALDLILPETEVYIKSKGLYGAEKNFDKEALLEVLKSRLNPKRFAHVLGVAETAVKYAKLYGADIEKAEIAGLLHDCTKDYSYETQLNFLKDHDVEASPEDKKEPIIHSLTAPISAEYDFGIEDKEILDSLRYHTTGRAEMTLLDRIIYVADFTEPTRNYSDVNFYREKAEKNLDEALFLGMKWIIRDKIDNNKFLHPNSIKMFNSLLK
ncbi:MAG: nicotinate (nicotinamide) nucleotide adenylyltransferase [Ruminococcaceae bacterium]|nr:nicotinate (nicotinamide) nucleotide adenylyltransferase [Oscillospiraceae bacterium]